MFFCIRDDDTNYFTKPEDLERAFNRLWEFGPISISVVPYQKGCRTKGVPIEYRQSGEVYPIDSNIELINFLRQKLRKGQIEIMLHGYHHEDFDGGPEFFAGKNLIEKVAEGKKYLEYLLDTKIRVFVPPHNTISRTGLRAVIASGLQLGCLTGIRGSWPIFSWNSWHNKWRIQRWGSYYPFIIDMGNHYELQSNAVTPSSNLQCLKENMKLAAINKGYFCLATHYWEFDTPGCQFSPITVREQLNELLDFANSFYSLNWVTLGSILNFER